MGDHSIDISDRPRPILDTAKSTGAVIATIGGIVTALVTFGLINTQQADAINLLLGLIPGVLTAIVGIVSAFRTATKAEKHVTPLQSPRIVVNGELVPLVPAPRA